MTDINNDADSEMNLLELLDYIDKDLADFCRRSSITDDEEIEEIWKMFRERSEIYN
jgi:hypothetical protein